MHQNRGGLYNKDDALWLLYKRLALHETGVVCLFCAVLYFAVLLCTVLFWTLLYTVLYGTTLYNTKLYSIELHCTTVRQSTLLY